MKPRAPCSQHPQRYGYKNSFNKHEKTEWLISTQKQGVAIPLKGDTLARDLKPSASYPSQGFTHIPHNQLSQTHPGQHPLGKSHARRICSYQRIVSRKPSSNRVLASKPKRSWARLVSNLRRGCPLGLLESHTISPSKPVISNTLRRVCPRSTIESPLRPTLNYAQTRREFGGRNRHCKPTFLTTVP